MTIIWLVYILSMQVYNSHYYLHVSKNFEIYPINLIYTYAGAVFFLSPLKNKYFRYIMLLSFAAYLSMNIFCIVALMFWKNEMIFVYLIGALWLAGSIGKAGIILGNIILLTIFVYKIKALYKKA
jgi:hypothetical protein